MLRAEAFIRFPVQGNVLESLDAGRLTIGKNTLLEPGCWITIADEGRVSIGEGCFLNLHTMIAAQHEVTIGDHTMFANHCFVSDASHRYDNPSIPVTWQGFDSKGPTRIGNELLVRHRLRHHERRDDRRPLCRWRQFGRHSRPSRGRHRRRRPGEGDPRHRLRRGRGHDPSGHFVDRESPHRKRLGALALARAADVSVRAVERRGVQPLSPERVP